MSSCSSTFHISTIRLSIPISMTDAMQATLKEVDGQGRVVLPAAWRRKNLRGSKVILRVGEGIIEIVPHEEVDLTAYFDAARVPVKADIADWRRVRRDLRKR